VALFYASANRDEEIFPDPSSSVSDRDPTHHLGFGSANTSVWAPIWRVDLRVFFRDFAQRVRVDRVCRAGAAAARQLRRRTEARAGALSFKPAR